ncbi:MAG: radical SAM protein [Candidatus Eisenbacteria bacterium]
MVRSPTTYADWYRRPALGLAYLCSYLRANSLECRIFDAYYNSWSEDELCDRVTAYSPGLVGLTAMTHEIVTAARIASRVRMHLRMTAVIGGCHCTALPERTLSEFPVFDYGICGEAEAALLALVRCLEHADSRGLEAVDGVVFRRGQEVVTNGRAVPLDHDDLDCYPMPAFDDYYGNHKVLRKRNAAYVLISSRGCPFSCAFCMRVLGSKVRRRSAESVCDEMEVAIERYGAHTFDFCDDTLLYRDGKTRDLLDLMVARGLQVKASWCGVTRADQVDRTTARMAKASGCFRLGIGVESGDDTVLETINKGITVEQVKSAVAILKEAGIAVDAYFIVGHPNETEESLRKTLELAVELNADTIAVGLMVPYPGTRIHQMATRGEGGYRLLTEDWTKYDKYGGRALELEGLPHEDLVRWQRRIVLRPYIKNRRFLDLARYVWVRRRALSFFAKRHLAGP